jgi:hypothetical protein
MNFPAFFAAEEALRTKGHKVLNPARNEVEGDLTWAQYMGMDMRDLMGAQAVALLPGWENSKGARIEVAYARKMALPLFLMEEGALVRLPLAA